MLGIDLAVWLFIDKRPSNKLGPRRKFPRVLEG